MSVLLVAIGGALGALGRWQLSTRARAKGATAAGGTLLVNVLGSFVLGVVAGLGSAPDAPDWVLPLLGGGLCGALTTFSSHAIEVVQAWRDVEQRHAAVNVALSVGLALLAVSLGWGLTA